MRPRLVRVAGLLFVSGSCALVYQIAWLRELRLVFGTSTAASATALSIFMAGLGAGSALLGSRSDRQRNPLAFYAYLELGIAAAAAASPLLLVLIRRIYIATGGVLALGVPLATLVRLTLGLVVLGLPTFLMGGTLPAAARWVVGEADRRRRLLAVLYGANTVGAVSGALLANFLLLEVVGSRRTLLLAATLNALVGVVAHRFSRRLPAAEPAEGATQRPGEEAETAAGAAAPLPFVLAAAMLSGFVFLLMELVWYRILTPLLGGTTFTFGLILAVALLGIGTGGAAYSLLARRRSLGVAALGWTAGLEALCLAVPFALGDRVAFLAQLLRPLQAFGFWGLVAGWAVVTAVVVLPAAVVAGLQFPLLVSLLGEGPRRLGRHVGATYAANTCGSVLGALAGGFGLLAAAGTSGCWRLAIALMAGLAVAAALLAARRPGASFPGLPVLPAAVALLALFLAARPGPTALWRQSPVGAGRVKLPDLSPNALERWSRAVRHQTEWEREGKESTIGLLSSDGYAFAVNGKIDGNAKLDAPRQVMMGLIGAALHPAPAQSLVVGLGTGSAAGWLADVPYVEAVHVVELEPHVAAVAEACSPVNRNVLRNPKLRLTFGDAREVLLTDDRRYDLVLSEPSNPYRAGVASLFTRELYAAVAARLEPGGMFLQWLQAYEVDAATVESILATLSSVFAHVEVWQTSASDLLLLASLEEVRYDVSRLESRLAREPLRSALAAVWRSEGVAGFLSRFVASSALARSVVASSAAPVNTDDRNVVEYAFARTVGRLGGFSVRELEQISRQLGARTPAVVVGDVDWLDVERERLAVHLADLLPPPVEPWQPPEVQALARMYDHYMRGELEAALEEFRTLGRAPQSMNERLLVAHALADRGDAGAEPLLAEMQQTQSNESTPLLARLALRRERHEEALDHLLRTLAALRQDPFVFEPLIRSTLRTAVELAEGRPRAAAEIEAALAAPFAVNASDGIRLTARMRVAAIAGAEHEARFFAELEPDVPWDRYTLSRRLAAYQRLSHPRLAQAERDLALYLSRESRPFARRLRQDLPLAPPDELLRPAPSATALPER